MSLIRNISKPPQTVKPASTQALATTPSELGYAAGILDGEGTLHIRYARGRWKGYSPEIEIGNTAKRVADFFHGHFGGAVRQKRTNQNQSPYYIWRIRGEAATTFLANLAPMLIVKQRQAQDFLRFPFVGPGRKLSLEQKVERRRIRKSIQARNRKNQNKQLRLPLNSGGGVG